MIHHTSGNLLESSAEALVNTVNLVGVMGKGIALQFKNAYPRNFTLYSAACKDNRLSIGTLLVTEEESLVREKKIIINFPTKTHWKLPSEYRYIEAGLIALKKEISDRKIRSVAIPPLGAGNGGLDWAKVREMIESYLSDLECDVYIYHPGTQEEPLVKDKRVSLTPARAMLLSVLYDSVRHGEFVSEFSAEKIAYFLQKFGAEKEINVEFKKHIYGPYSGKIRHLLYYLNGKYILGYSDKDTKPFEGLSIVFDAEPEVEEFLNMDENRIYKEIVEKTKDFLFGFYSAYALELLSTVDFIVSRQKIVSEEAIFREIEQWSERKKNLFAAKRNFLNIAINRVMLYQT
jgi:O-acetyl-ADP-ribose deacetylase (regulator of RNase III)